MGGDHLWEEVSAIGQMLGSIAVFITLVYLAIQTRHARSEARRALSQGRTEAVSGLFFQQRDGRVNDIYTRIAIKLGAPIQPFQSVLMERVGLSREETSVMANLQFAWWAYRLQIIPNVDELSPVERTAFDVAIRGTYGQPGVGQVFYETFIKTNAHPAAVRYVDNLIAQPG